MTILAKTYKGTEYLYSTKSAHAVSKASACDICDTLNANRYNLTNDEQTWHVYEIDEYDGEAFYYAEHQKFTRRKGYIYRKASAWLSI